jgi:hypothetical protein
MILHLSADGKSLAGGYGTAPLSYGISAKGPGQCDCPLRMTYAPTSFHGLARLQPCKVPLSNG